LKNYLKWAAIGAIALIGLLHFSGLSLETQRWAMLGAFLGWSTYAVPAAIEKARVDLAMRIQNAQKDVAWRLDRIERTLDAVRDRLPPDKSEG
jgi:hypothetical protein